MACSSVHSCSPWAVFPLESALASINLKDSFESGVSSSNELNSTSSRLSFSSTVATSTSHSDTPATDMDPAYARRERSPPGTGIRANWNGGDREELGRRSPRSRYDRRPGRERSRSPVQIDRYQPGREREYQRRNDNRRRAPSPTAKNIDRYVPGQEPAAEGPVINPIIDPLKLDCQVGFSYFAEWWRKEQEVKEQKERQKNGRRAPPPRLKGEQEAREEREKEHPKIQASYDSYKEKLQVQMAKAFVHQHRDEEWFKERYDSDVRNPFRQRQADLRREHFAQWMTDLDNGAFDDFTLEGIYKNDSNGAGGVVEKEEGEAMAATEVLGVGDLVPMKGGELRDERAEQPALLIKTIAPHVSREKIEAFCKQHLGDEDGGFKWLSLSDPNPQKKFHRIGWIMLNPGEDVEVKAENDNQQQNGNEAKEEDEDGVVKMDEDSKPSTRVVSAVDRALGEINGKTIEVEDTEKGGFVCHVGIHVPPSQPRKKALWDLFSSPERVERDLQLADRIAAKFEQELGEDANGISKIEERVEELRNQGLLQPQTNGAESKAAKAQNEELEEGEDEGMVDEEEEGAWDEDNDDEELVVKKKKLDMLVEYLRRVHNFCFFCVFESDSVHELMRKCPGGHLRRPRASLTTAAKSCAKASAFGEEFPLKRQEQAGEQEKEDGSPVQEKQQKFQKNNKTHVQLQRAFNWVKTYEDKLFQLLEPDAVDLVKLGGRPLDDALDEELKKFVKQEDESKYRCRVPDCTKLFKGETFWRKHVEKRHAEWYEKLKKELCEINHYVLDPAHIQPSRSDATSNGHFATNPHAPTGTPRGFSLQNFGMPNNMQQQPAPFMNAVGFGMPPMQGNWGNMGPMAMDGAVGPMRKGAGRFQNRSGPYERQGRGGRRGGGRLSPAGKRFPDAAQSSAPREATAGRSLKSYEDLDAVGGPAGSSGGGGGASGGSGDGAGGQLDY